MQDLGKLILRLGLGLLMLTHGWPKLMKLFAGGEIQFPDPLGIGALPCLILTVFAEFVCVIFVMIGYKSKWFSIPIVITMLVAAFVVHGSDPLGKKELALIYAIGYSVIYLLGNGKYALEKD